MSLGILSGRDIDRDIYLDFLTRFKNLHPEIEFSHIAADDKGYKAEINNWLSDKKVDVSYGQSGSRLCQLAADGRIAPLDELWEKQQWNKVFSNNFRDATLCQDKIYGVPFVYYYWGFFYKKSVFKRLGITPPQNWQQMLEVFQVLKSNNMIPVTIGTKNSWPAAAWFDYLNLRINGLAFHQKLLKGQESFLSENVREVMHQWKSLLDTQTFITEKRQMDWQQALPFLYRDMAGMILTGSFLVNILPERLQDDIGFFRFPSIKPEMPFYEEVPTDVYMLNQLSIDNSAAEKLLVFGAQADIQSWISAALGYLPPNKTVEVAQDYFAQIGQQHISSAAGYSQYFDRDANFALASHGMNVLANFMEDGDVEHALKQLEKIRLSNTAK